MTAVERRVGREAVARRPLGEKFRGNPAEQSRVNSTPTSTPANPNANQNPGLNLHAFLYTSDAPLATRTRRSARRSTYDGMPRCDELSTASPLSSRAFSAQKCTLIAYFREGLLGHAYAPPPPRSRATVLSECCTVHGEIFVDDTGDDRVP